MKYISLLLDIVVAIGLWILAIYFYSKNHFTFTIIFITLGFERLNIANLYWKIENEKDN